MTELASFLLARIAEREATARAAHPAPWTSRYEESPDYYIYGDFGWTVRGAGVETSDDEGGKATADLIAANDPAAVLADCASKRAIVEMTVRTATPATDAMSRGWNEALGKVLLWLAQPFTGHPDYDPRWDQRPFDQR